MDMQFHFFQKKKKKKVSTQMHPQIFSHPKMYFYIGKDDKLYIIKTEKIDDQFQVFMTYPYLESPYISNFFFMILS